MVLKIHSLFWYKKINPSAYKEWFHIVLKQTYKIGTSATSSKDATYTLEKKSLLFGFKQTLEWREQTSLSPDFSIILLNHQEES